mmetsp:Transcript_102/g.130  ORF Transcript_102/g.130 Transcript_102/m.130 type:complete len:220 (-) Transcript_102:3-662(-)
MNSITIMSSIFYYHFQALQLFFQLSTALKLSWHRLICFLIEMITFLLEIISLFPYLEPIVISLSNPAIYLGALFRMLLSMINLFKLTLTDLLLPVLLLVIAISDNELMLPQLSSKIQHYRLLLLLLPLTNYATLLSCLPLIYRPAVTQLAASENLRNFLCQKNRTMLVATTKFLLRMFIHHHVLLGIVVIQQANSLLLLVLVLVVVSFLRVLLARVYYK